MSVQIRRITPKVIRKPKQKRCKNPACGEMYTPHHAAKSFECWCSPVCGTIIARQRVLKAEAKKNAQARREHRAKKKSLKPLSKWLQEAQADFNAFIRLRDCDKPCISCGRTEGQDNLTGGYWHAGHYRTTAAQPSMRFNELNCHKQCPTCNNYKSGNLIEYRIGLVNRLGPDLVEWLDRDHPQPSKWEIDEIKAIRDYYRGATKALRQYMAGE